MRTITAATIIAMLLSLPLNMAAADDATITICADDTRGAISRARQALQDDSGGSDRAALTCLVEAVARLDDKLQGLDDGSRPFEGQIYIPKGWVIVKPPSSETD